MYEKYVQLNKNFAQHRDPDLLRALLRLPTPKSLHESQAQRYQKCGHPACSAYGTVDRPLDLHHIVPRSQSKVLVHEFTNHIYLCGDFFPKNHHKSLHGQQTPGRMDWLKIGVFEVPEGLEHCDDSPASLDDIVRALLELGVRDHIARVLLKNNLASAIDYARKLHVLPLTTKITEQEIVQLQNSITVNNTV